MQAVYSTKSLNILVTTLGRSWSIVPELIGFTNPGDLDLYRHHSLKSDIQHLRDSNAIAPIDLLWIVTTANNNQTIDQIEGWLQQLKPAFDWKIFVSRNVELLDRIEQTEMMADLIYRVVLHAHLRSKGGQLLLSLAGGRKTMSADMQQAAHIFGCHALLHIIDRKNLQGFDRNNLFLHPLSMESADFFMPLITATRITAPPIIREQMNHLAINFPLDDGDTVNEVPGEVNLYREINQLLDQAQNLLYNYSYIIGSGDRTLNNFRALYTLSPDRIKDLWNTIITADKQSDSSYFDLIHKLPKAELHCHLGGILNPDEMIEVALANSQEIERLKRQDKSFKGWLETIAHHIKMENLTALRSAIKSPREIRTMFSQIPEPYAVAGFLALFKDRVHLLESFIYGDYLNPQLFRGIGIEAYEKLGDLQGSALLQNEASIRAACRILVRKCREHHVQYLELRHSPAKYTRGGLTAREVIGIIREALHNEDDTQFKGLFIASRHGTREEIIRHVELARELIDDSLTSDNTWLVGFDLAGVEAAGKPAQFREIFMPLMEQSFNLTIHAGENESVKNIWSAIYHLNADRIGHGLTLNSDPRLKVRFLDRKIALEMCPSSNDQIVGYSASPDTYPLKGYLNEGLRVTINTDNPGISRTDFSQEYFKAASFYEKGFTLWEVLQIIRNGFRSAFLPYRLKQRLIINVEKQIMQVLNEGI